MVPQIGKDFLFSIVVGDATTGVADDVRIA